jgi:hypothetical protein
VQLIGATTLHAIPGLLLRVIKAICVPTPNGRFKAEFAHSYRAVRNLLRAQPQYFTRRVAGGYANVSAVGSVKGVEGGKAAK